MEARWNNKTIAKSDKTIIVEGNHYFPPESVHKEFLTESSHTTKCPWKGTASYYNVVVEGKTNINAAWCYTQPFAAAAQIKGYIAFWNGVEISD